VHAKPGDVLIVGAHTTGQDDRKATIVEVRAADGSPPYRVRWPDGHEALTFPGPDARVAPQED
jgi:hypothetical protein